MRGELRHCRRDLARLRAELKTERARHERTRERLVAAEARLFKIDREPVPVVADQMPDEGAPT